MADHANLRVMIAGIGGASLGTEIAKCLRLAGGYEIFGCDISATAFGLYSPDFASTYRVDRARYVDEVLEACHASGCRWLIPGGEQPMVMLGAAAESLSDSGVCLVANSPDVIRVFSDKQATFETLKALGIEVPRTSGCDSADFLSSVGLPCIVKPATGSGGSSFVFFATSIEEVKVYVHFLRTNGHTPVLQEYVDATDGEFTVGVLSLPDCSVVGSVALRRSFDAKLSVAYRGRGGLISSGYSQGLIGDFADIRKTAETIAKAIGSRGPINVQGRVRNGCFLPFEINPRFSASTYLRAMAGFNEVDIYLRFLASGRRPVASPVKHGWYLRTLSESFIPAEALK